jgi:Membrane protease subunits, stomatin/prohibitin homologs
MKHPISGSADATQLAGKFAPLLIIVILLLVAAAGVFVTVDAGTVGVVKRFGAVRDVALPEGLHFKIPFAEEVVPMTTRLTASEAKATAASRDLQIVTTDVTTTYAINGALAPLTFQRVGTPEKIAATIVNPCRSGISQSGHRKIHRRTIGDPAGSGQTADPASHRIVHQHHPR